MKRVLITCAALLAGCSSFGHVEPWQKGTLARAEMGFDSNKLESRFDDHMHTSREAASGGAGVGAGGCGCN